jgi:collagenase-like PrtC family protease
LEICASVLGDIDSVEKAAQFAEAGADIITPDVGVNRDLRLLNKIKAVSGAKIKLMVNEGCLYRCAYRKFHFNLTSHRSREPRGIALTRGGDVYADFFRHCVERSANDLSQVIKSCWIRPEDLCKYGEITDYFKIVGRCQPKDKVVQDISAYMQQNWSGNLFDLLCASLQRFGVAYNAYIDNRKLEEFRFFEKVTSCDRDCDSCNYCDELAARLIRVVLPDGKMINASTLSTDAVNACD